MASTKDQIQKAALKAFKTEEVSIGDSTVVLREMSPAQKRSLNARLYICDPGSDEPTTFDDDGKVDPKGDQWHFVEGIQFAEEWISATIEPAIGVEEMVEWPLSLKRDLFERSRRINGIEPPESVAKNS